MDQSSLTPAQVKQQLGLSTKQLRLYADKGLIRPKRKAGGWRVFGREDLTRLYQIKVLRNFGFSLEKIAQLLNARGVRAEGFAAIVRLQADTLRQEQERVSMALTLLGNAQQLLAQGRELDVGALVQLSEFAAQPVEDDLATRIRPFVAKYFDARDYRAASQASVRNWQELIDEAVALLARDPDPASTAARDLQRRWLALSRIYSGGDAELEAKSARMFEEAMSQADASRHPIPLAVWNFLKAIRKA